MRTVLRFLPHACAAVLLAALTVSPLAGQTAAGGGKLILSGDIVYFLGRGVLLNCVLNSRFKPGDPVGFRMTAINPDTGTRDRKTELVVHLDYGGRTIDLPMTDHESERNPEMKFWVAKWIVPDDAPVGTVRYSVTARDPQGRTGEWKPFENPGSLLTIVHE